MSLANATNPFAPNDEDMAVLWLDRTNFLGAVLGGAAWGLHAVIVWLSIRGLMHKGLGDLRTCITIAFVFILFVLGTLNFAGETGISLKMFVNNRGYPGGPTVYLVDHYDDPINQMGNSGYIIANFFTDGLMLWRTFVVWNRNYFVVILPFLLYLASTTMSVFVMDQISQPTASLWTTSSVNFTLSYFSMSITLNVLLTLLIAGRLISMSQRVKQTLGAHHAKTYTSIASMMIESAVPYSALGIAFIATFATNNPAQNAILPILSQVMCISPELIVWRVATGRSWSKETTGVTYGSPILGQTGAGSSAVQLSRLRFATTQESDRTQIGTMSKVSMTKDEIDSQV